MASKTDAHDRPQAREIREASIASAQKLVPYNRPRWVLHVQAEFWRVLMSTGMFMHRFAPPRPPHPNFSRTVKSTISDDKGEFNIQFYLPSNWSVQKKLSSKRFPCIVNFHGGGFTLGTATDDARWCKTVVDEVQAVVASVDYRLAPEHPFPVAVEDGADAVKWVAEHAEELFIDVNKIAISGFSSGANMCFTVPICLENETISAPDTTSSSTESNENLKTDTNGKKGPNVSVGQQVRVRAIISWYPPTDYTQTREERRATCTRTDQQLSTTFTDLFDESYLHPPTLDVSNPILSPGVAPKELLECLPDDIIMYTCEYDMLLAEGEKFRDRLRNEVGKNVIYQMVPKVPHGWDKAPNPIKPTPGVSQHYLTACKHLRRILKADSPWRSEQERRRSSVVR